MSGCSQDGITDAAVEHLAGIHTLDMRDCSQYILGSSFTVLSGITELVVSDEILFSVAESLGLAVSLQDDVD